MQETHTNVIIMIIIILIYYYIDLFNQDTEMVSDCVSPEILS